VIRDRESLPLSLSLSLTSEERTLESIKHAHTLSVPHPVSHLVSMRDYYINSYSYKTGAKSSE